MPPLSPRRDYSLYVVGGAILLTGVIGFMAKRGDFIPKGGRVDASQFRPTPIELELIEQGLGEPPFPDPPPSAAWLKLRTPNETEHAVSFRGIAHDADGKELAVSTVWSQGTLYALMEPGYGRAKGPITVNLSHRGHGSNFQIPSLPDEKRRFSPELVPSGIPGIAITATVDNPKTSTSLRWGVLGALPPHEMVAVRCLGTDVREAGPTSRTRVFPSAFLASGSLVTMPYLDRARAARFEVCLLRSEPYDQIVRLEMSDIPAMSTSTGKDARGEWRAELKDVSYDDLAQLDVFLVSPEADRKYEISENLNIQPLSALSYKGLPVYLNASNRLMSLRPLAAPEPSPLPLVFRATGRRYRIVKRSVTTIPIATGTVLFPRGNPGFIATIIGDRVYSDSSPFSSGGVPAGAR